MGRLPAGAMCRDDQCRVDALERSDRWLDERLKDHAGEMKSADKGIHRLDSGQFLGVANGIDYPRVPTARQNHEALRFDIHNYCLVVMYHRVLPPLLCNTRVVDRKALLKGSRAVDLSRHQQQIPQEIRRLSLFDELDALVGQKTSIRRRETQLMAIREDHLSFEERI